MVQKFQTVVLGAGPGGYVAAIRASQLGLNTAIIEEKYWGGVCLNVGCIPSKALLRNAELANIFKYQAETFGIEGEVKFNFKTAFNRSREVAGGRVKGIHYLMKKNNITEFNGRGKFIDSNNIEVLSDTGSEIITFDNCIIATGAKVNLLPGTNLSDNVVTYEQQILSNELPESIVIIGAGAIGVEFAYILNSFGVKVTIIEYLDRILPNEDQDISKELTKAYQKLGIKILTATKVEKIVDTSDSVTVNYVPVAGGEPQTISVAKVLISVGFTPNIKGFGLENTGVKLTNSAAIEIDEYMRTNVPGIYAIGDVTAKLQLAHVAEAQGVVAAETIAGTETLPLGDYFMMPRVTFCQPQVASFGLTEAQAREKGYRVKVAKFPFMANGKAHGIGETVGFVKLICDEKYGELLGGHLIGPEVGELLPELTLAQKWDLTVNELVRNIHTHPTLSESIQEVLHGLNGHMINF